MGISVVSGGGVVSSGSGPSTLSGLLSEITGSSGGSGVVVSSGSGGTSVAHRITTNYC